MAASSPSLAILFESRSANPPTGTRRLVEELAKWAGWDGGIAWLNVPAATTAQARKTFDEVATRLDDLAPGKVLAMGPFSLMAATRGAKRPAILSTRGRLQYIDTDRRNGLLLMGTLAPKTVWSDTEFFRDFARDVVKLVQSDAPVDFPFPDYYQPADAERLAVRLAEVARHHIVSVDVETTGFDPMVDELLSIGLGTIDGPVVIVDRALLADPAVPDLLWAGMFEDGLQRTVLHNAKFDLEFLARYFGSMPTLDGARLGDTMLLHHQLDERPVRSKYRAHGLKDLARTRYDVEDYHFDFDTFHARLRGDEGTEPLVEADWDEMHAYHAMDCRLTAVLWRDLAAEAAEESPRLMKVHDAILMPATLALAEAELRGVAVDRDYLGDYLRRLDRRLDRRLRALRHALDDPEFSPGSPAEVNALLFNDDPGWGLTPVIYSGFKTSYGKKGQAFVKRNSSKEHLAKLASEQADRRQARIIQSITAWRHDAKARETYAAALLRASAHDGRVRASFNLGGTVTGRLSSSNPNLQNIPKRGPTADAIRRAFVAPPGWSLAELDYSQLELRVAALLSGDEAFAAVYRDGRDIHSEVAAVMFRKPAGELTYMERYLAKAVDFGAIYGRSGKAIADGAEMEFFEKQMGGTKWTAAEAQEFVERFLDGFPRLRAWMDETGERALVDRRLETIFGRVRRFPFIVRDKGAVRRQAFNTPIQSVASDICLSAFSRLGPALDPDEARVLLTIHDSIMLEVRDDAVARVIPQVQAIMEDMPAEITALNKALRIPFAVDAKVGKTWMDAAMHELP